MFGHLAVYDVDAEIHQEFMGNLISRFSNALNNQKTLQEKNGAITQLLQEPLERKEKDLSQCLRKIAHRFFKAEIDSPDMKERKNCNKAILEKLGNLPELIQYLTENIPTFSSGLSQRYADYLTALQTAAQQILENPQEMTAISSGQTP